MKQVHSKMELGNFINENDIVLLYFGSKTCGVCHAMKPKVEDILLNYPKVISVEVDIEKHLDIAATYSIFTIPGILLFIEGKETIREARYISIDELNEKISRYYAFFYEKD